MVVSLLSPSPHRTVRKHAQSIIRPGIRLVDMCESIEEMNRSLVQERGLAVSAFSLSLLMHVFHAELSSISHMPCCNS